MTSGVEQLLRLDAGLDEAKRWCALRAAGTQPPLAEILGLEEDRSLDKQLIERALATRQNLLRSFRASPSATPPGRLLCNLPDESAFDGASQWETSGLLDLHDIPQPDFWVGSVFGRPQWPLRGLLAARRWYLVSWVPAALVDRVQDGIDAEAMESIGWFEGHFARQLPAWLVGWATTHEDRASGRR